jgi:mercuric reductase
VAAPRRAPRSLEIETETLGLIKIVAEACEIIQVAAIALYHGMTVTSLGEMLFPYLTHAEALKLCAQTFSKDIAKLSCCAG